MKPYQGILALISYFLLRLIVVNWVSREYYDTISGIIALLVFGWLLHKKHLLHMSSRDLKGSQLLSCLGIGFGLALFSKISILVGFLSQQPVSGQTIPSPLVFAVRIGTDSVLIPIVEELLFRAILFGSFARFFSYKAAILLSTVFFTLGHFTISWPTVFVIGTLLAWIYWRTDNLAVAMVIHCTVNFFSLLSIPLYALMITHRAIGVTLCLLMLLLGIAITYLSIKKFLQKHDALPA